MTTSLSSLPEAAGRDRRSASGATRGLEEIDGHGGRQQPPARPTPASSSRSTSRACAIATPTSSTPTRSRTASSSTRRRRHRRATAVSSGTTSSTATGSTTTRSWSSRPPGAPGSPLALIDWCERRGREIARRQPDRPPDLASAQFAFGGDTELEGALAGRGYTAVRWDAEMLRPDLEDIPEVPARRGLRAPDAHRGRAARRVRDDRRGVRRALGPVRGGRAAPRRVDRGARLPPATRWSSPGRATSRPRW